MTLNGTTSTDPDNAPSPLTYAWSQLSGTGVSITNPSSVQASAVLTTAGTYTFRLTVNDGAASATDDITVTVSAATSIPALFVVGNPAALSTGDTAIRTRLQSQNYTVTTADDDTVTAAQATGTALVLLSTSVDPAKVSTKFRTTAVPVVTWKGGMLANMGMASSYINVATQNAVSITTPGHPIAAGRTGTVTVASATSQFKAATALGPSAVIIASIVGNPTQATIFAYDTGAAMIGLNAPARRVGLFMDDTTAATFTTDGWALFDTALNWARSAA